MRKDNIERICANCQFSTTIGDSDACFCDKKGFVKAREVCRRFKADYLKIIPPPPVKPINSDNEIFNF